MVMRSPGDRLWGGAACLAVVLFVAACQAGDGSVLPPRPASGTPTPAVVQSPSVRPHDAVLKTYVKYWKVLSAAGKSSPEEGRALLRPYVQGAYLDHLVDGIRQMTEQGQEPYGEVVPRVKEVRVGEKRAEVTDCQDTSMAGMADRRTHQLIPGTTKKATANITASLEQSSDGRWRLTGLSMKEAACTPLSR
ncbi:hypothetical protein ACQP1K_00445 [Sphaerimonospora sp. CA-214678]|uniref:hypothetical protein n=1 Tax=Sphaerimonospora sp. CA-214678 TaxID=3240029 RepID=UPI003D94ED92